jgi:hypothetical protein
LVKEDQQQKKEPVWYDKMKYLRILGYIQENLWCDWHLKCITLHQHHEKKKAAAFASI